MRRARHVRSHSRAGQRDDRGHLNQVAVAERLREASQQADESPRAIQALREEARVNLTYHTTVSPDRYNGHNGKPRPYTMANIFRLNSVLAISAAVLRLQQGDVLLA